MSILQQTIEKIPEKYRTPENIAWFLSWPIVQEYMREQEEKEADTTKGRDVHQGEIHKSTNRANVSTL